MSEHNGKNILEQIDDARTEAQRAIFKVKALVELCKDSISVQEGKSPPEMDFYAIIFIFGDLAEAAEGKLCEIEETTFDLERKEIRIGGNAVHDTFIDLDSGTVYRAADAYEMKLMSDFQRNIESLGKVVKGHLDEHRAKKSQAAPGRDKEGGT